MGVLHWYNDKDRAIEQKISRADVKHDASGARAMLFAHEHASDFDWHALEQVLTRAGIQNRYDIIDPGQRLRLSVNGFNGTSLTPDTLEALLKSDNFNKKLRLTKTSTETYVEGFASYKMMEALESTVEAAGYRAKKGVNTQRKPVLRLEWEHPPENEAATEKQLSELLQKHGYVTGEPVRRAVDKNPVLRASKEVTDWVNQNPARAGGILYSIGNIGQFVSGAVRGNSGEAISGLSYLLPNADLALGARPSRIEKDIVRDALDDFSEKEGKRDFGKSSGFMSGSRRYGGLIGDYLNWRERPQNIMSVKSLFNIFAGYSAFRGGLKGRKTLVLDAEGNVQLDEHGLPKYEYKRDAALLYDGTAAMIAYVPVATLSPRSSDYPPPVDVSGIVTPLTHLPGIKQAGSAFLSTPVGKVTDGIFKTLQDDPAPTMRTLMGSRNILHFGFALQDGIATIPHRIEEYRTKFVIDAFKMLTPQGGEHSHYATLREHFPSIQTFVDSKGQLTAEAQSIKDTTIDAYETRLAERSTLLKTSHKADHSTMLNELDAYLKQKAPAYEYALLLGCFDKEDRSVTKGIPLLTRHKETGSYEKLIKRHEAKLQDPYHEIKRGGPEEQLYITALNRKFADQLESSRNLPWMRLFYSVANLSAAWQLGRVNNADKKPETNNLDTNLDSFALYESAAKAINENLYLASVENEQERKAALTRAADNMALKLSGEREVVRAKLSHKDIRDGIIARLEDRPTPRQEQGYQLANSSQQQQASEATPHHP